jgi:hypothetical protein
MRKKMPTGLIAAALALALSLPRPAKQPPQKRRRAHLPWTPGF